MSYLRKRLTVLRNFKERGFILNEQKIDNKRYLESLKNTPGPVTLDQVQRIKMDLKGLSNYAVSKGVHVRDLSKEEIDKFIFK